MSMLLNTSLSMVFIISPVCMKLLMPSVFCPSIMVFSERGFFLYICCVSVSSTITGSIILLLYGQTSTWLSSQFVFLNFFDSRSFGVMSFMAMVIFWYLSYL